MEGFFVALFARDDGWEPPPIAPLSREEPQRNDKKRRKDEAARAPGPQPQTTQAGKRKKPQGKKPKRPLV